MQLLSLRLLGLVFPTLIFLVSPFAQAQDCADRIGEYVAAGDLTSQEIGARTWDFRKLARDMGHDDQCARTLFDRAGKEASDYWKHIAAKYSCIDAQGTIASSATCSQSKANAVRENLSYIRMVGYSFDEAPHTMEAQATCTDCNNPDRDSVAVVGPQGRSLQDIGGALAQVAVPPSAASVGEPHTAAAPAAPAAAPAQAPAAASAPPTQAPPVTPAAAPAVASPNVVPPPPAPPATLRAGRVVTANEGQYLARYSLTAGGLDRYNLDRTRVTTALAAAEQRLATSTDPAERERLTSSINRLRDAIATMNSAYTKASQGRH